MGKAGRAFTLDYWEDEGWLVGRLREHPEVISQGKNLDDLMENIVDAYHEISATRSNRRARIPVKKFKTTQVEIAA